MSHDYLRQYKYYEILFSKNQISLTIANKALYLAEYIKSSFYVIGFDEFKELYDEYFPELKDYSYVYFPLDVVTFNQLRFDDYQWVITFTDRLLYQNIQPKIRLGIYFYQELAYERMGNLEKAKEINEMVEKIRNDIINGK